MSLVLRSLDKLLQQAVSKAQVVYGSDAAGDPYRGLYVNQDDVEGSLEREPGVSHFLASDDHVEFLFEEIQHNPNFKRLQEAFELSAFDMAVIIIALAPEIDLRYERIYAYLQDDVTRSRPTIELAFNLLCASESAKLSRWLHFAPDAPLIRQGLLELIPDPNRTQPPLLAYYLKLDEQIIRWLLGHQALDSRLSHFSQLHLTPAISLEQLPLDMALKRSLEALMVQAWETQQPLRLYFYGPHGVGKQRTAVAIASRLGVPLITADLLLLLKIQVDFNTALKSLFREVQFQKAIVYLTGLDVLLEQGQYAVYQQLLAILQETKGITILASTKAWDADKINLMNAIAVEFSMPDFAQRQAYWQANLVKMGIVLNQQDIDILSDRFRLTPEQIDGAIATACNQTRWKNAAFAQTLTQSHVQPTLHELLAAARKQSGQDLTGLARKISPKHTWDNIILPSDQLRQLREICNQVKYHHIVCEQWGFEQKLSLGKGVNVLFSGSPGTGKTMASEVIANELQLDLYKIDLSQIVSKYIGETEKNLDRVFTAAVDANAILLFDEADALFGKRSEVKDAHDRYANLEIAYLLQKMEEYEGITILTTNLRQNLDEAFTRRIRFIIEFPFPEADYRLQIWQKIFPQQTPLGTDVDLKLMAQKFKLAGGNIRNIALAAAFLAAEDGECVAMKYLLQATKREFQKMGRLVNEEDF
jgi:SpoVK/Ycf46/Vps4 family AAA+-type ATPase